ncbi:Calcineurin-like phosphoesterase [Bacillus sp. THAF10]|uniref:lamin tail domain-containing protein n=1 Tax=Bacillus sp. THAF10 TaxID=2587848 RepID=UPI0012697851|nr:lamin tail domain-containing protein [Bacillus sp. THAF10]QFT88014.1 Calcineurin-like phosphoesterase [Bacillus sp. THAF10]
MQMNLKISLRKLLVIWMCFIILVPSYHAEGPVLVSAEEAEEETVPSVELVPDEESEESETTVEPENESTVESKNETTVQPENESTVESENETTVAPENETNSVQSPKEETSEEKELEDSPSEELPESELEMNPPANEQNSETEKEQTEKSSNTEETYSELPLLITELSPNSKGGGTDFYEFFEVYNNTNQPMNLGSYSFFYKYTDSGNELAFQVPMVELEPQETIVLWFNVGKLALEDFNQNFGANLSEDEVVAFTDVFPGFANGGNRALVVKNQQGQDIVSASYLGTENDNNGNGINYIYPEPETGTDMKKLEVLAAPTPGAIKNEQVPTLPLEVEEEQEDIEAPVITHKEVTSGTAFTPVKIEASVTDNIAVNAVTLYYKTMEEETFRSVVMNRDGNNEGTYSGEIPAADVQSSISYYIEASDGKNVSKTEEYLIDIAKEEVDFQSLPPFLVTEVVPDSTNVGSADGYEFIEIYNNTDKDINFKNYKIQYRYGAESATDVIWPSIPDDVVIPSKKTLVFWIINNQNQEQTVADFNANYGVNLVENQEIVRINSDGMANAAMRGLVVATNAKQELAVAYYNDVTNVKDTASDKAILYKYPTDGSTQMLKISAAEKAASPGAVEGHQVPKEAVKLEEDTVLPTYENLTSTTVVDQTEDIKLVFDASDNNEVKTVRVFYRTNDQEEFSQAILPKDYNDLLYHYTIFSPDIIAKEYVEYYVEVSDGWNVVKSETYKIDVTTELDFSSLRLNVKDGDILNGNKTIKGTSSVDAPEKVKLFINQNEVGQTFSSVEHTAYFAFEVSGINTYFQNGVTIGDEVLQIFDDWINEWQTVTVPINPDRLPLGENTFTIRAGTKASPFDLESTDNRDDFNLRNVRLVLADGTIVRDQEKNDPTKVYDMGNDGTYRIHEDFTFSITEELAPSKSYKWDTTTVPDGEHTVKVVDTDEEVTSRVIVDNTAPSISTSIEEGKEYKGAFTISSTATDEIAGVQEITTFLDNEIIETPYDTSSSKLPTGERQLKIVAVDKVGNKSEELLHFTVVDENPLLPELVAPLENGEPVNGDPTLKVKVTDPTEDDMDVTFYGGFQYDASISENVKGFKHANDIEPPAVLAPEGEIAFSDDDIARVTKEDKEYLITDSSTQFPYHRFNVQVDASVMEKDRVELVWKGNSLEGRKVTMYAWSHDTKQWEIVDYQVAGKEDFELIGEVDVASFVENQEINVLIQDEIPESPEEYDYTFVWMSDTQYYSESFPHIYEQQTEWIAAKQEEMKIEYVFHTGDLVNASNQQYQWEYADKFMGVLDQEEIPYGVLAGNHDVDQKTADYTEYYRYFGADRFENKPYYGGSYLNNKGHYDLISSQGNDYIMVYLGWGIDDEGIKWVNEVLAAHPDRIAILSFHEYLQATGVRHPMGDRLYQEIVLPNENVVAVLSGHYHESQLLVDEVDDNGDGTPDRQVYQMLADYQAGPEGGQGFMRLLHFDTANNRILVNTYSPYLDQYNYYDPASFPGKDEFILELDLAPTKKRVATDYFSVNVYTENEIGSVKKVPSGETAEMVWRDLEEDRTYWWYVVVEDEHTGRTVSDIWSFVKGKAPNPEKPDNPQIPDKPEKPGNPEKPENPPIQPENPEKPESELNNPETPDVEETNKSEEDNENSIPATALGNDQNGGHSLLPHTATNLYNYLIVGLILLAAGSMLIAVLRFRRRLSRL